MISNTVLQIYNPRDTPPGDEPSAKKYGAWLRAKDHSHTNLNPQGNDHQSTTQNARTSSEVVIKGRRQLFRHLLRLR